MKTKRIKVMVALATVLVVLLASCAKATPTTTPAPAPAPTTAPATTTTRPPTTTTTAAPAPTTTAPRPATTATAAPTPAAPQGDLKIVVSSFAGEGFDPVPVPSATMNLVGLAPIFDHLISTDRNAALAPSVVEKWEVGEGGLSWIYQIRKGIKFHNGDSLTAADVKFSLDRFVKESRYTDAKDDIDRVEIVDEYTVRVYTKGVKVYYPYGNSPWMNSQGQVQPKAYVETRGVEYFKTHPVGSGPFKFVSYKSGDSIKYEANTDYWRGAPAFKNLTIIQMPEESTAIAALKTGEVDLIDTSIAKVPELEKAGFTAGIGTANLVTVMLHMYGTQTPQAKGLPLADVRVRQALSLAINRAELNKSFFYGKGTMPVPAGVPAYAMDIDTPSWKKQAADTYLRYDAAAAKQLLTQAGFPNGFTFRIFTGPLSGAPFLPQLAEVLQAYWKAIGVTVQIVPVDQTALRDMRRALVPDILGQMSTDRASSNPVLSGALLNRYGIGSTYNLLRSGAANEASVPEIDSLLNRADSEPDAVKRGKLLDQAIQKAADLYVVIALSEVPSVFAHGPKVSFPPETPAPARGLGLIAGWAKQGSK